MDFENAEVLTGAEHLYHAYVFDMDGALYLGDHLLPGAKRMLEELPRLDLPVLFPSNNPARNSSQYVQKLRKKSTW